MTQECEVRVEGKLYTVMISDEEQTLLAAKAAGRVVVGLLHGNGDQNLTAAEYLVEELETADERYLERIVRRHLGLPWIIAESERLVIREFTMEDIMEMEQIRSELSADDGETEIIFCTSSSMESYIRHQYHFYEYGIWAVVRKSDHVVIGMAGVSDCDIGRIRGAAGTDSADADMQMELGYHIFSPYQRKGYAVEACRIILDYVKRELEGPVYAVTNSANERSVRLLAKLKFELVEQRYNAERQLLCLYGWNC